MAKSMITFTDDEHGGVKVTIEFTPPMKKGEGMTPAQSMGVAFLEGANKCAGTAMEDWAEQPQESEETHG